MPLPVAHWGLQVARKAKKEAVEEAQEMLTSHDVGEVRKGPATEAYRYKDCSTKQEVEDGIKEPTSKMI